MCMDIIVKDGEHGLGYIRDGAIGFWMFYIREQEFVECERFIGS